MVFDQATRNRLQRFVNDARKVLEAEFNRQLQNEYGLDPVSGTVTPLEKLVHLTETKKETARILRDILAHYLLSEKVPDTKVSLERIVREQAFTVLNRIVALRMAESRGLLIESIDHGYQAKGFQLYARVMGNSLGETGETYRTYLFSVFDELSEDLPGLFDRYSPQGRLFPRETALLQLLELVNQSEISMLWAEDETIGWVFQYFNSKEERKQMRDASAAPRNSRELAVRNQFFTPRYVVEFLVDNTLGRFWFNETGGKTSLKNQCQYLLVKPDEEIKLTNNLKDPRTLKLLDPACGSMHFGLYAFDLFIEIYREAWMWEQQNGPGSLDVSLNTDVGLLPLCYSYSDVNAFMLDVPRLIIERNIFGVDIDARAVQIASLALWLRAQRWWHESGVKAKDRPTVGRGHVVAAIAPPQEKGLLEQLKTNLDKKDAELLEKTLQMLKNLPELGVLLRVEQELPALIRQIYGETGGLFKQSDEETWQNAELRLREALVKYAQAAKSTYQCRLFSQDAMELLRIIDLIREKFDVVVMNPPFGGALPSTSNYLNTVLPAWCGNLSAAFVIRMSEMISNRGLIGCVVDKTILVKSSYEDFRREYAVGSLLIGPMADLGWDVLDGANVEVVAAIFDKERNFEKRGFVDCRSYLDKSIFLRTTIINTNTVNWVQTTKFSQIPNFSIAYDMPEFMLDWFSQFPALKNSGAKALQGHAIKMDWYGRLWWEVDPAQINAKGIWSRMYNGGKFSTFGITLIEVVRWNKNGEFLKHHPSTRWSNAEFQQRPGVGYGKRGNIVDAHLVPAGHIFTVEGLFIYPAKQCDIWYYLGILNSKLASIILNYYCGQHKHAGYVNLLPIPNPKKNMNSYNKISYISRKGYLLRLEKQYFNEVSGYYRGLPLNCLKAGVGYFAERIMIEKIFTKAMVETETKLEEAVEQAYEISSLQKKQILAQFDKTLTSKSDNEQEEDETSNSNEQQVLSPVFGPKDAADELLSHMVGIAFGRWRLESTYDRAAENPNDQLFDPINSLPPAMNTKTLKVDLHENMANGIFDQSSLIKVLQDCISCLFQGAASEIECNIAAIFGVNSLEEYFNGSGGFFDSHLKRYSNGRKQAPIYWPISTASGYYSLWLYYPIMTDQTLYTAVNDFLEPKIKQVADELTNFRAKGNKSTLIEEKQLEGLQAFKLELVEMREKLLKIAPTYHPNHDDGVQITAAPLWSLFQHKPWQKVLKETWEKLEKGDYDWAHLAMNYWPDRVRAKCKTDKSLAIAHGLEELYVEPATNHKKKTKR